MRAHARKKSCFKPTKNANGHRFNLVANNGRVIGTSETYKTSRACENGMNSVRSNAPGAKVEKV